MIVEIRSLNSFKVPKEAGAHIDQDRERREAELFDVKLSDLLHTDAHDKMIDRPLSTWQKAEQVSFYQIGTRRLWGYRIGFCTRSFRDS